MFAPFSVHLRRLLKGIWIKNGQHWDNEVDPSEKEDFLRWKEQLPIVAETSIDRRYFSRERDKAELHVFAEASEDTMCAVAYLGSQSKEYTADLAIVIGKCRVAPMRHLSIPRLEMQVAVMAVMLNEQIVKEHEMKINSCSFGQTQLQYCSDYTVPIANNKCLWPIEWLRYYIQLMFHSENMSAVLTTQLTLAPEQSTLKNSREVSGSRGRPG